MRALYWLLEFNGDGVTLDDVSSMIICLYQNAIDMFRPVEDKTPYMTCRRESSREFIVLCAAFLFMVPL